MFIESSTSRFARPEARSTLTSRTPGRAASAACTWRTQFAHVIPVTAIVCVDTLRSVPRGAVVVVVETLVVSVDVLVLRPVDVHVPVFVVAGVIVIVIVIRVTVAVNMLRPVDVHVLVGVHVPMIVIVTMRVVVVVTLGGAQHR